MTTPQGDGNSPTQPGGGGGDTIDNAINGAASAVSGAVASIGTQWVADLAAAIFKPIADWFGAGVCNTLNQTLNTLWFAGLTLLGVFGMAVGIYLLASETGIAPGAGQVLGAGKTVAKVAAFL